jgi:hypothetical protein
MKALHIIANWLVNIKEWFMLRSLKSSFIH